jgi:hypothetical protein
VRTDKMRCLCFAVSLFLLFLPGSSGASSTDVCLGSEYKGNYVWGVAMNLAWNELSESVLHQRLRLNTNDAAALEMVDKLNRSPFRKKDLDKESYYIKSGFGQKTVELINAESSRKFPGKSFGDLELSLTPTDIIAYAYFLKKVEYVTKFDGKKVRFGAKTAVNGFYAKDRSQKNNIRVLQYVDDDHFIISLKLKHNGDQLFVAKGFDMSNPGDAVSGIKQYNRNNPAAINPADRFEMPKLHLDHRREYSDLIDKPLANSGYEDFIIKQMFERIKFDMDQIGARVENEAVIITGRTGMGKRVERPKYRNFILDKPFWVVMQRRTGSNPYFILGVRNGELMEKE